MLAPKQHFVVVDGLRGIAALCVVAFHFTEMNCSNARFGLCHGFLAVDFFFCLSGFVLGYAYNDRVGSMGPRQFLLVRLVRLHPMVVCGTVLGLLAFLFNPFEAPSGYSLGKVLAIAAASLFLVPYSAMHEHGEHLFGLNPPAWSLFWEYFANVVFAIALYRFRRRALCVLGAIAAVILCMAGHHAGNLSGGWGAMNFAEGGSRLVFSFSAGLLLYRLNWRPRTPFGFGGLSFLLVLAFLMPYATGGWMREAAIILLYFPLLILLGTGAVATPRQERWCRILGNLSYPLYMTHYAAIWIWDDFAHRHRLYGTRFWLSAVTGVLLMTALSLVITRYYDKPVRRYLFRRFSLGMNTIASSA